MPEPDVPVSIDMELSISTEMVEDPLMDLLSTDQIKGYNPSRNFGEGCDKRDGNTDCSFTYHADANEEEIPTSGSVKASQN